MTRSEFEDLWPEMECKHCHEKALRAPEDQVFCANCGAWQFQLKEARLSALPAVERLVRALAASKALP